MKYATKECTVIFYIALKAFSTSSVRRDRPTVREPNKIIVSMQPPLPPQSTNDSTHDPDVN